MQLALGDALAVALLERRNFSAADFKNFHPGGKLGASLSRIADVMHQGDALPLIDGAMKMDEAIVVMTEKGFGCSALLTIRARCRHLPMAICAAIWLMIF